MKKGLSFLCAVVLLLGLMVPVSAAHDIKISASKLTAKPGDQIFVQVAISGIDENDENFMANWLSFKIKYDETKFDFGADLNGDGEIKDYKEGRITITETTSRAQKNSTPWSKMNPMPAFGLSDGDTTVIPFDSGATPQFNNGEATVTFNSLGAATYTNGALMGFYLTVKDNAAAGDYPITFSSSVAEGKSALRYTEMNKDDLAIPSTFVNGSITVEGSTPTPTAKTVTYTAVNGTVFASLAPVTSFGEGAPVASSTITTAGTDPEEAVYFYFFPNKGFTVEGMTIDGEPTIGSDISRKFTVTADKEFTFSFAKIADGATPALAAVTGATTVKEATKFATFGTATGASDFGIIIAKGDTLKDEAGLKAAFEKASETGAIRKYAAEDANADGQFAIEVNGPLFAKGGTYIARMYAANGGNVTFGEIIDIAIAE